MYLDAYWTGLNDAVLKITLMRILGIDPGLAIMGYGIIKVEGNRMQMLEYGCVTTASTSETPQHLKVIYDELQDIIRQYSQTIWLSKVVFQQKRLDGYFGRGKRSVEILTAVNASIRIRIHPFASTTSGDWVWACGQTTDSREC